MSITECNTEIKFGSHADLSAEKVVKTMKTMRNPLLVALGLAVTGLGSSAIAGPVPGQEITLTYKNSGPYRAVRINYLFDSSSPVDPGAPNRSGGTFGFAGFVNWDGGVKTFCCQIKEDVDPDEPITFEFALVKNVPDEMPAPGAMGAMRETMIRDLYSRWWSQVNNASDNSDGRDLCAAFQAMVWEITHETIAPASDPGKSQVDALALQLGAMQLNSVTDGTANYFDEMKLSLGGANDDQWLDYIGVNLWGLTSPDYQDQLIVVPGAAAGFIGLGIFGARRRRRR